MFTFDLKLNTKNKNLLDKINSCACSVAIQIRLGDYSGSIFDITNQDYFCHAIDYFITKKNFKEPRFFVFSNEIEKSKQILSPHGCHFNYVNINDNDHGAYDMYLMSQCQHFIISNSSFGFWPALLSQRTNEKIVIQPSKWLRTDTAKIESKYPGWICFDF
jgi:hypothetical protein